jgi:hypothetical protein
MTERDFNCCTPYVLTPDRIAIGGGAGAVPYSIALGTCAVADQTGQVVIGQQLYATPQDLHDINTVQILYTLANIGEHFTNDDYMRAVDWLTTWLGRPGLC